MKYGNFVGEKFLEFTDNEINEIGSALRAQLESVMGKDYFCDMQVDNGGAFVTISFPFKSSFSGRNLMYETVSDASEIHFLLTKKSGYLEVKRPKYGIEGLVIDPMVPTWEKDYENAPEFSYGCTMAMKGKCRVYRSRTWVNIQSWNPYVYGSEISDLAYDRNDLDNVRKTLTAIK